MEVKLVSVGNSRGIRIPKAFIEQCGLGDTVELSVEEDRLMISPRRARPRKGWKESFAKPGPSDELRLEDKEDPAARRRQAEAASKRIRARAHQHTGGFDWEDLKRLRDEDRP